IRYHHNYIYDRNLIPGMLYKIEKGKIIPIKPQLDEKIESKLLDVFKNAPTEMQEMAKLYQPIFSSPTPSLLRMAYDIEVEESPDGSLPNPRLAKQKVISISFAATDGLKKVYCLDRDDLKPGIIPEDFPKNAEYYFFKDERLLLKEAFRLFWKYPIIITFNGDNFDNTYLFHRARKLKIKDEENPIYVGRGGGMVSNNTDFKHGIHIDIFQFFANRSIKGYAFGGSYLRNSLEEVASSLLGSGKIKHEGIMIGEMTLANLIHYNLIDSMLTLELTTFNNDLVWNLIFVLMRITKLPLQDIFRLQISAWVRSLLFYEHRRKNFLIPRGSDLEKRGKFSKTDTSKFQGAYVIDPIPGIHFNVAVLDFSSLYPSIIKTRNLSYETVMCIHPNCQDNMLENTPYWACTKKMGIFAYVVGYLRDIRVKWFKPLSSDKSISVQNRQAANVMASALKVFINSAYGVYGSNNFPLYYRPVAEATTAIGRYSIKRTIDKAKSMGVEVLYGDSDSVFLLSPSKEQIEEIMEWSTKELDLDLELEKIYQFLALSERKKNYIGVRQGGQQVDLKGLLAKKHNTPEFIKKKFREVQDVLTKIVDDNTFEANKKKIIRIIRKTINLIGKPEDKGGFHINDYGITIVLKKKISAYTKNVPQHVRVAKMLSDSEKKNLVPGSFITYVKTRTQERVKPINQAKISDIDYKKYKEMVRSTFEQVLDALSIKYEEILGTRKLSSFF
ncbi:MAG: DNA-directed DNA polymerase I, partial [Promethearchaeota archaeon]